MSSDSAANHWSDATMATVPRSRYLLFWSIALVGCAADLITKAWVFSWPELRDGAVHWLWTGYVGIQLSWNQGALFGFGQGMVWVFAGLSTAAALAIPVWLFWFRAARDVWVTAALGGIMAGVLGNLYDRLGLPHHLWPGPDQWPAAPVHAVRDWILWQFNDQWRWPNFNLADSLLVVSTCVLVYHTLRNPEVASEG
jgi:signal peptidase II